MYQFLRCFKVSSVNRSKSWWLLIWGYPRDRTRLSSSLSSNCGFIALTQPKRALLFVICDINWFKKFASPGFFLPWWQSFESTDNTTRIYFSLSAVPIKSLLYQRENFLCLCRSCLQAPQLSLSAPMLSASFLYKHTCSRLPFLEIHPNSSLEKLSGTLWFTRHHLVRTHQQSPGSAETQERASGTRFRALFDGNIASNKRNNAWRRFDHPTRHVADRRQCNLAQRFVLALPPGEVSEDATTAVSGDFKRSRNWELRGFGKIAIFAGMAVSI